MKRDSFFFLNVVNRLHLFILAAKTFWKPQTLLRLLHQRPSWACAAAGKAWGAEPAAVCGSVPQLCHWHGSGGNQAVGPAGGKLLFTEQFYFLKGKNTTTCRFSNLRPFIMLKKSNGESTKFYLTTALCSWVMSSPANCLRLSRLTCYFPLAYVDGPQQEDFVGSQS